MYENFYNLVEKPFDLTPSRRFLYMSEGHKEALALLKYGVLERKGFILLTGEVGTGKTTMVRALLDNLDKSIFYVHMSNPLLSPQEFINYLSYSIFKKEGYINAKAKFLLVFRDFLQRCLKADRNFNLIIDEAHMLSYDLLEEIRLLSNLETGDKKLMNIFLVGQPELNEKLSELRTRPLLQRISIRYHIPPLNMDETSKYMETRLMVAGSPGIDDIFTKNSIKSVYRYTKGYPREINILADNALLLGYSIGKRRITPSMIKASYEDMKLDRSLIKNKARKASHLKTRKVFSPPFKLWKAACIIFLITVIPVFAASRHGREAFSKLKFLFPQSSRTAYSLFLSERDTSKKVDHQLTEDLPETNEIHKTNTTNETNEVHKTNEQVTLNAPLSSTGEVEPEFEDVLKTALPKSEFQVNENNQTNLTNKTNETNNLNKPDFLKDSLVSSEIFDQKTNIGLPLETLTNNPNKTNETEQINNTIKTNLSVLKTVTVKSGDNLSKLVAEAYGSVDSEIIAFIKKHNPDIEDINKIEIGQKILFPPLSIEMEKTGYRRR